MKKTTKTTTTYEYDSEGRIVKKIVEEIIEDEIYDTSIVNRTSTTSIPACETYKPYTIHINSSDVNRYQE